MFQNQFYLTQTLTDSADGAVAAARATADAAASSGRATAAPAPRRSARRSRCAPAGSTTGSCGCGCGRILQLVLYFSNVFPGIISILLLAVGVLKCLYIKAILCLLSIVYPSSVPEHGSYPIAEGDDTSEITFLQNCSFLHRTMLSSFCTGTDKYLYSMASASTANTIAILRYFINAHYWPCRTPRPNDIIAAVDHYLYLGQTSTELRSAEESNTDGQRTLPIWDLEVQGCLQFCNLQYFFKHSWLDWSAGFWHPLLDEASHINTMGRIAIVSTARLAGGYWVLRQMLLSSFYTSTGREKRPMLRPDTCSMVHSIGMQRHQAGMLTGRAGRRLAAERRAATPWCCCWTRLCNKGSSLNLPILKQ